VPVDRELLEKFLTLVDQAVVPTIKQAGNRFTRRQSLLDAYQSACETWRDGNVQHIRDIMTRVNELCIAKLMLEDLTVSQVEYEVPLAGVSKTIDFQVRPVSHPQVRLFYDVKTVQPEEGDAWERYEKAKREGWFMPGTELILEQEWMGREIAHEKFAARQRFIEHALQLEEKIESTADRDQSYFRLVFCGDGMQWHETELEDFAESYFLGTFQWDHFARMQTHWLKEHGRPFQRSITGFCAGIRKKPSVTMSLRLDVRAPKFLP
jgi:hypothetical protein